MRVRSVGALIAVLATLFVAGAAEPAAAVPASVTVSPHAGLVDDEPMLISVRNWVPSTYLIALQCVAGAPAWGDNCDYVTRIIPGRQGNQRLRRPADVIVDRRRGGPVDCRVTACELIVRDANGPTVPNNRVVRVPLAFDPAGPDPIRPSTTVTTVPPDVPLDDGDTITVTGNGFPISAFSPTEIGPAAEGSDKPARPVYLQQCRADDHSYLDCDQPVKVVGMTRAGHFSTTYTVRSRLYLANGGSVDCVADPCALVASSNGEHSEAGRVELAFDAGATVRPAPTVTVTPPDDLAENQVVTITATDFAPNQSVVLSLCPPDAVGYDFLVCHDVFDLEHPFSATDADGTVTFTHAAHPVMHPGQGPDVDCRAVTCSFVVTWGGVDEAPSAPVLFDPDAPAAPPQLTASPATGLAGGQEVEVSGEAYAPVRYVYVVQCVVQHPPASEHPCGRFSRPVQLTGDRTSFTTHYAVRRRIVVDAAWVNCARRACYLATVDDENQRVRGPRLAFTP